MKQFVSFDMATRAARRSMLTTSSLVHTGTWQGVDISQKPEMATHELLNYTFQVPVCTTDLFLLGSDIKPNLPWADDHFQERVCGYPLNPGKEWANWPYAKSADTFRDSNGQFNHSYMERYWPRLAGGTMDFSDREPYEETRIPNRGVRGVYGDLDDVVNQLVNDPTTRQAYLPIFFPEDTGAVNGGRVPCSLGYHFILRGGYLHISYWLRSCDLVRHFRDDIYLTVRLLLWMVEELKQRSMELKEVKPGIYTMYITSLHCFRNDYLLLKKQEEK